MQDKANAGSVQPSGSQLLVLVLGMHRSGTSVLTRSLQALGLGLGNRLSGRLPCNPKGFFEDVDVCTSNELLLDAFGLNWSDPGRPDPRALRGLARGEAGKQAAAILRGKLAQTPMFGLKDPRLCRLLPFWRPVLAGLDQETGLDVKVLFSLRRPCDVALSLAARDQMEAEKAHALWLNYSLDALTGSTGLPGLVVSYERMMDAPGAEVARIGHFLGLEPEPAALSVFADDFVESGLCHHRSDSDKGARGPWQCLAERLYKALLPAAAAVPGTVEASIHESREILDLLASLREHSAKMACNGGKMQAEQKNDQDNGTAGLQ